ncbi:DKNYY domain-containing protein [Hyalangium minutum]|uniref:Uncharacterized protein n=1 Tax=Hyalangium minutum TaxID=394096 RepID=A0A085WVM8_9BACT|nr:DKNYY domain-containing protein [Hyalangium minutum]KFE71741.1 hypothetical protein DB31_0002 [Hyalangium minutum]
MLFTAAAMVTLSLLTASPEDSLVGRWGVTEGKKPRVILDLPPNRLAQLVVSAGIWTATEKEIQLVNPDRPDKPYVMPYSFEGEKLKVILDKSPVTLDRLEAPPEYKAPKASEPPQLLTHGFVKAGSDVYTLAHHDGGFMAISANTWAHVPGASAASFEGLAKGVGKDASAVYCFKDHGGREQPSRLEAADPKTFRVLFGTGRIYFADAQNVFTECSRLVKRERSKGKTRLTSFDTQTFALGPCALLKDRSGAYAAVPLSDAFADPSKMKEVLAVQEELTRRQLWVYEKVSGNVDALSEQGCDKLPTPAPLTLEDLASGR